MRVSRLSGSNASDPHPRGSGYPVIRILGYSDPDPDSDIGYPDIRLANLYLESYKEERIVV